MAALAHALAGGCTSWLGIVAAAGLSWPAAVAALGRRRTVPALALWLLIAQVITHVLLDEFCPSVLDGRTSLLHDLTQGMTPQMLGLHALSVVVTAVVLGRADAGLWAARTLIRTVSRLVDVIRVRRPRPAVVRPRRQCPPPPAPVLGAVWRSPQPVRRGPPELNGLSYPGSYSGALSVSVS